jgi:exodeoxyribonuclease VIII
MLVRGKKSMKALKRAIEGGFRETPAMTFGSQYHAMVLEPEDFERTHCVVPDFSSDPENVTDNGKPSASSATKYVKAKQAEFYKQNSGRQFISRQDYDRALCMIESIRDDKKASELIDSCDKEQTLIGEIDGVPCKGRLDLFGDVIVDLKGSANVAPVPFGNTAARLGYGFKLAFYRELARQVDGIERYVYIIAIETDGDFDCVVYPVPAIVLDNSLHEVRRVISDYKLACKTGVWHGINRGEPTVDLYIPNWSMTEDGEVAYVGEE